jgi:cytochrome b561
VKKLTDSLNGYGSISIFLHWIMAVLVIGLFILGEYMMGLNYYDSEYLSAYKLHRDFGMIVAVLLVLRMSWRLSGLTPNIEGKQWQQRIAIIMHRSFYALMVIMVVSGYLVTSAKGQDISVFGWVTVPATIYGFENQEDIAGEIHEVSTHIFVLLVVVHTVAALKHHFINRDSTLQRMLRTR